MKRIPTILGLVMVVLSVFAVALTVSGLGQVTRFLPRAAGSLAPAGEVGVANVTDSSFTVYWLTTQETVGTVNYGRTPSLESGIVLDDRDSATRGEYFTHFVRVVNLKPETKYHFRVAGDQAAPREVTTGPALVQEPVEPIFGKILDSGGIGVAGAIVVWQADDSSKIASLSKSDGSFVLPVANARKADLKTALPIVAGTAEKITFLTGLGSASIACQYGSDRPLPSVKIGENADCAKKLSPAGKSSFKTPVASNSNQLRVNITEGETVSSPLPTIGGKAGPNQVVKITINSETPYSGTVKANPDGSWSWTPPAALSPGKHTATITVTNTDGTTQTVTRTFFVTAGSPILPITSGTPSAELFHFQCQDNACVKVSGSGSDTCASDADCAPAPLPPPSVPEPPEPAPPATGAWENTMLLLTLGGLLATLGIGIIYGQRARPFA